MPLPDNFRTTEHLLDTIRKTHNPIVRNYFRDAKDDDIKTPRSSLKQACLIQDNDSTITCLQRYLFYHLTVRKGQEISEPFYGVSLDNISHSIKGIPQVVLYFKEDAVDVDPDFEPLDMIISFRLVGKTQDDLSDKYLEKLAKAIKREFATGQLYRFHKGKEMVTYVDTALGYRLKMFPYNESDAINTIKKVLAIRGHKYDETKCNVSNNKAPTKAYPTLPKQKIRRGKKVQPRRQRAVGKVRFQHATIPTDIGRRSIELFDGVGALKQPILRGWV